MTRDSEDLEHGIITNSPENKGTELAKAPENSLEDVGLLDGDVVGLKHLDLEAGGCVSVRSAQIVQKIEDCQAVLCKKWGR